MYIPVKGSSKGPQRVLKESSKGPQRVLNESSSLLIALAEYSSREAAANPLACSLSGVRTQAYCLLAGDNISVPLSPWTAFGLLERAQRYWNGLRPWNAAGFLRLHVHVCAMETQKITSVKNTKFCKYEVETIAGTRRLQNQPPHTCFFIGPLRGKISSPFVAYVSIFSP